MIFGLIHFLGVVVKYFLINFLFLLKLIFQKGKVKDFDFSKIDTIVFTHNLGGGTFAYEKQNFYKGNILILRLVSYRNDCFFYLENESLKKIVTLKKLLKL